MLTHQLYTVSSENTNKYNKYKKNQTPTNRDMHHITNISSLLPLLHTLIPDSQPVSVHVSWSLTHHSEPLSAHHHLLLIGGEEKLPRGGFDFKHLASRFKSIGS